MCVFYETSFKNPRGKTGKSSHVLTLLKPARGSSTQFYPFEILRFPLHQWNQGADGCQEMFHTSRKVPHLKNLHIPSRVVISWRLLGVFLGWSPRECLEHMEEHVIISLSSLFLFCFFVTRVFPLCWRTTKSFALYNIRIHRLSVHCCQLPFLYLQSGWLPCIDYILLYNFSLLVLFVDHWIQRWAIFGVIMLFFWLLD